ncbi:MAG: ABC transporter permease subunit [gamma proteobacterium symbiont of Phacoides pectinatus]
MWDWDFTFQILPDLLRAFLVTVQATILGMSLALVLGLAWAILRRARQRIVSMPIYWMVEFIRSTPLLVQIYFLFFVFPDFGIRLSPLTTGVVALGLHYSAYSAEVYRAGIEGVQKGQWEVLAAE